MKPPRKHVPGADKPVRYGYFSRDGLSYVVTSLDTPRLWCNLLSNHRIAAQFAQSGQGFIWYLAHNYEQVTNWQEFQYCPSTMSRGRLVFIKDRQTGAYWAGNPQPGETGFRDFSCTVEPGVSTIRATRNGIAFTMRAFIPWDADVEIWTLTLRNTGRKARKLAIYPAVEFPTRRIHWFFKAAFHRGMQAVRFVDNDYKAPKGAFFACSTKVYGHETSSRVFYGPRNDRLHPKGIEEGLSNSPCENDWCVGVLETRLDLASGEEKSFHVFTGRAYEEADARKCLARFRRPGAVEKALAAVREHWVEQRSRLQVQLPDRTMQVALNCWVPYCVDITTRFRQGTKVGYRDTLQYSRAFVVLDSEECREKLLRVLRYQYASGRAIRGYMPHSDDVDVRDARDGVSWIADTLCTYIKETGDAAILDVVVPYFDKGSGTVWEHACRAVEFLYRHRGRHKQCLVGGGDWNDALELGGGRGRGESVWLSIATCRALRITAELARRTGHSQQAAKFERWRRQLAADVNRYAWDGEWYIYGFTDDGRRVGTHTESEGAIYANVQTWALMENIVPPNRVERLWKSIEKYLMTDVGVLVHHPAYTKYRPEIGRITGMPVGAFENASAYAHGTAFYIAALAAHKKGSRAVEVWHTVRPTNPLNPHSGCEPYACTTYYTGPASKDFGFSPYSWFTGSISWVFFQAVEGILGVRADFDGLRIDPAIPPEWKQYRVVRQFRGGTYEITVRNPDGVESGVRRIVLDGKPAQGNLVPLAGPGQHTVDVVMG